MSLELLGLGVSSQAVYTLMLEHPDLDLPGLQATLGLGETELRAALDDLADLALVRWTHESPSPGAPLLMDPDVALTALITRRQAELAERQAQVEQGRAAIAELLALRRSGAGAAAAQDTERLVGVGAVRDRISALAGECQREIWSFSPGGPQSPANMARSRPLNAETLGRGVRMRTVYLDSVRNDEPSIEHARWLTERGAEVRTVPTLPLRMLVVDREVALVPLDENDSSAGALLVSGRGVVAALSALFVSVWRGAQPLGPRRTREPERPSEQEQQALRGWAQGDTDHLVARRLWVSERTVRRISDNLAELLGARSRFELAARAMDAGWLDADDLV